MKKNVPEIHQKSDQKNRRNPSRKRSKFSEILIQKKNKKTDLTPEQKQDRNQLFNKLQPYWK